MPPLYGDDVIYAVRNLCAGNATPGQQKLVWDWLAYATGADDISFRPGPDGERATAFAEGKRFVGQQFRKMLSPELTPDTAHPVPASATVPAPKTPKRSRSGGAKPRGKTKQ